MFVATINSYDNTNYEIQEVTENGENISIPYTNYSITVLENIKGNLKTNEHIPLQKYGGIREDGKKYILYENDFLPEEGKTYIFLAFSTKNGGLLLNGPTSNVLILDAQTLKSDDIKKTSFYLQYVKAYENEVDFSKERHTISNDFT